MVAPADITASDGPDSTPKDGQSAQETARPIVTPLTWEDALELADAVIYHDPDARMDERIAFALMRVDMASREQARAPMHDATTCQTCIAIKARRADEDAGAFYDARDTDGECGD